MNELLIWLFLWHLVFVCVCVCVCVTQSEGVKEREKNGVGLCVYALLAFSIWGVSVYTGVCRQSRTRAAAACVSTCSSV